MHPTGDRSLCPVLRGVTGRVAEETIEEEPEFWVIVTRRPTSGQPLLERVVGVVTIAFIAIAVGYLWLHRSHGKIDS